MEPASLDQLILARLPAHDSIFAIMVFRYFSSISISLALSFAGPACTKAPSEKGGRRRPSAD